MFSPGLRLVLLEGTLSPGPFTRRQLIVGSAGAAAPPPNTRAVVLVAGDINVLAERARLVRWGQLNLERAMNEGYGCLVAARPDQVHFARQTLAAVNLVEIPVLKADPDKVAQFCLELEPGPPPDRGLQIVSPEPLKTDTEILFRRAFNGFKSITLSKLNGGRSSTDGVWRVEADSTDAELWSPFVVKCGRRQAIDEQVRTYRDVVADRVPFRGCAPLCLERSVPGYRKRLSVSRFVEHADRLDDLLIKPDCQSPEKIVRHIFEGPLHRWRTKPRKREVQLLAEFLPARLRKKYRNGLIALHRDLPEGSTSPPADLYKTLAALPPREVPICRAHDDLNFRNVFVAQGGAEIILIDFTRAAEKPLAQDIARMDVGLAFDDELNEQQPITDDVLEAYFAKDLFSISLPHNVKGASAKARLRAIEALRHQMLVEAAAQDYDPTIEYAVAIIAGLFYEAKRRTKWSAIAYRCADALVATL